MRKLSLLIFCLIIHFFAVASAEETKILVLPDSVCYERTNYYIYTEPAELFSTDIISSFNASPIMNSPSIYAVKKALNSDLRLKKRVCNALSEFKSSYAVDYDNYKSFAQKFNTDKVLLITSNLDSQNYILRRTLWDFLNIPGATVTDAALRVSTFAVLLDTSKDVILWQNNYQKLISSRENRIIPNNFAPGSEQLEKLKKYSLKFISPHIANRVQFAVLPMSVLSVESNVIAPDAITIDHTMGSIKSGTVKGVKKVQKKIKTKIKEHNEKKNAPQVDNNIVPISNTQSNEQTVESQPINNTVNIKIEPQQTTSVAPSVPQNEEIKIYTPHRKSNTGSSLDKTINDI